MDDTNPFRSSSAAPRPLEKSWPGALRLFYVLLSTSTGCGLAAAIGYWAAVRLDSIAPAVVAMAVLPAAGAWLAKVRDPQQLLKIAAYGGGLWLLCYALKPAVSGAYPTGTPDPNVRILAYAFVPSSLLAVIGAGFACRKLRRRR